ncbi:FHA domain-containing protein [Marispirochaeta aestuarii]|uniref:FHA domain-containing protein n=1 Tax=Marispirochaeta aestuarii TaxID=1963862 RepID=UPI0029C82B3B|nr:FHA domain-containing protein [Marispirochaeta aestuarii]
MTRTIKKILYILLGFSAGCLVWVVTEPFMAVSGGTFYLRLILQGGLIGAVYGGVLGAGEGISVSLRSKALLGASLGFGIGLVAGVAAILVAQGMLLILTGSGSASIADITERYLPVARILGWTFMGALLGTVEGIRAKSLRRALFGVIGGTLGGLIGGLLFEGLNAVKVSASLLRLLGFCSLGLFIGGGFSLLESLGRFGVLKVMNGRYKGKEFILSKKSSNIGSENRCDISIPGDPDMQKFHARVFRKNREMYIERKTDASPLFVNDKSCEIQRLKYEDVLRVGHTVIRFLP